MPRQGPDLDESTIPQEAWLDRDAVSFTKGCFLGQELVCRIDTRGHVNRLLRWLVVEGDSRAARSVPRSRPGEQGRRSRHDGRARRPGSV